MINKNSNIEGEYVIDEQEYDDGMQFGDYYDDYYEDGAVGGSNDQDHD